MKRRALLGMTASSGVLLSAGCLGFGDGTHATIQRFYLFNTLDEPATIVLRIERNDTGELVHEERYELPSGESGFEGRTLDCVWPDEPLDISIRREVNTNWNTTTTADDDGCLILIGEVNQHGTSYFASREECPVRSSDCHPGADS